MSDTPRPAARLTLVVPSDLASGFRLAGADVEEATDAAGAGRAIDAMLRSASPGLIGVYAPLYTSLPDELLERCERSSQPIVIPLPSGLGAGDGGAHRARIAALLERAVGYHIEFAVAEEA